MLDLQANWFKHSLSSKLKTYVELFETALYVQT